MIALLLNLLILLIVLGVIWYIVSLLPLPAPFGQIAQIIVLAIGLIAVLYMLVPLIGDPGPLRIR